MELEGIRIRGWRLFLKGLSHEIFIGWLWIWRQDRKFVLFTAGHCNTSIHKRIRVCFPSGKLRLFLCAILKHGHMLVACTVCAEKNDRSLTFHNGISRKDRAMKLMAYERTWPNVQYDWVSLSYHENSLSGFVFYKNKNIAHSQPSHQPWPIFWPVLKIKYLDS